jgi:hypothetical protein
MSSEVHPSAYFVVSAIDNFIFCSLSSINSLDRTSVKHEHWTVFGTGLWVLVYYAHV